MKADLSRRRSDEHALCPRIESWIKERYERSSRGDTFDALKRRAAFNRQDAGLLKDWTRAAHRAAADQVHEEECP